MAVRQAVENMDGVDSVDANPNTKNVVINYDPAVVKLAEIEAKLSTCGFPVAK